MNIKEIMNDPRLQDKKCLVLLDKTTIDTPSKPKPPKLSKIDLLIQEFREFKNKQEQFNQKLIERLDNIVSLNKLKE